MLPILGLVAWMGSVGVALPPPLCRGSSAASYDPLQDRTPSARAVAEIRAAYDALCPNTRCGRGEIFENPTMGNNAATWVSGVRDGENTRAKIVYSARFLDALAVSFGDGASFGVLAHEVGHHLTAALSMRQRFDSSWDEELRADYLAGCALGRSGRSPGELESALRALAEVASGSHPSFNKRNPVVRKGYNDCAKPPGGLDGRGRPSFGIGALLRAPSSGKKACWKYGFRTQEEVKAVGPVAAPRRISKTFSSREHCEEARRVSENREHRTTEDCRCDPAGPAHEP